jgi:hypothetical protein
LRGLFKKSEDNDILKSIWWYLINVPFDIVRNLTIPSADPEDWDKIRMVIVSYTIPIAFMILNDSLPGEEEAD